MAYEDQRLILEIVKSLRANDSWAGRTHVQKAAYLLHALCGVNLPFEFVLYKHGPYSFDLDGELNDMLSYAALEEEHDDSKYGAKFKDDALNSKWLRDKTKGPDEPTLKAIEEVAKALGEADTRELEKLATAAWILSVDGVSADSEIADRLHDLKPHVTPKDAEAAVKKLRSIRRQLKKSGVSA